jgi:hypothetical protein
MLYLLTIIYRFKAGYDTGLVGLLPSVFYLEKSSAPTVSPAAGDHRTTGEEAGWQVCVLQLSLLGALVHVCEKSKFSNIFLWVRCYIFQVFVVNLVPLIKRPLLGKATI